MIRVNQPGCRREAAGAARYDGEPELHGRLLLPLVGAWDYNAAQAGVV